MFIVLLKFSNNKTNAAQFMDGHKAWIERGIDDGVFLLVGSLQPNQGGGILAHGITRSDQESRVNEDHFCEGRNHNVRNPSGDTRKGR